jgi:hypothetical protein
VPSATLIDEVNSWIAEATARIEPDFFLLPVAGVSEPMPRERVYCYELYHQLRDTAPREVPLSLQAEVDKAGHPALKLPQGTAPARKPDFIFHEPGSMDRNVFVLEVKPANARLRAFRKDIMSLSFFVEHFKYRCSALLVYGGSTAQVAQTLAGLRADPALAALVDRVTLFHHERPGIAAVLLPRTAG